MRTRTGKLAIFLLSLSLACAVPQLLAPQLLARKKDKAIESGASEQKRAAHALNRLSFGPRPGDIQQVMAMGVDKWIDLQLHPDKINDSAVEARLAPFRTLHMSSHELVQEFPDQQMVKQVAAGKKPMPSDPAKRAIFNVQMARLEEKKEKKEDKKNQDAVAVAPIATGPVATDGAKTEAELAAAANADMAGNATNSQADGNSANSNSNSANSMSASNSEMASNNASANDMAMAPAAAAKPTPDEEAEARRREDRLYADLKVQQLIDLPPDQRYKKVLAMSADEQLAFADSLRGGKGQESLAGLDAKQKETLLAMNNPQGVVTDELVQAKLLRAVYSERQLEEVMTDFWFNHFNVFVNKGADRVLLTNYEQDVIRPRALGKFEDLLVATAKSPAMLFYLDNWLSVGPESAQALGLPANNMGRYGPRPPRNRPAYPGPKRKQNSGLNENYGRELLELHTLSVNGGYSQRDVTEVAKVFTGWTIDKPYEGGGFRYDPRMHEPGPKFVLGHRIKPKGEDEGREVLHKLATSPQTAHFISLKLAERFISDEPPPDLIDRMAKTFLKKKGDIREVLSMLFLSPEFWADSTYRSKVKTPLEFVASAVRATGADIEDALPLSRQLNNMGMSLYGAQPPTGYPMKAEAWVSSSALLNRMNFALSLTSGKVKGVKLDQTQLMGSALSSSPSPNDATMTLSSLETTLLAGDVSRQTHDSILAQVNPSAKAVVPDKVDKKTNPPKPADVATMSGLLLGSPEFQRR